MKTVKTIVLDNGVECYLLEEITEGENTYYFLANMNDDKDLYVRKKEIINGEEYLCTLDNVEELTKALDIFKNKHQS